MRCEKCGYISFDYLSECRKCGVNLASVRDALGYLPFKPEIPSFLGSLLKDYGNTMGLPGAGGGVSSMDLLDTDLPEIDFGEDLDQAEGLEGLGGSVTMPSLDMPESRKADMGGPGADSDHGLVSPVSREDVKAYGKGPQKFDEEDLSIDFALESAFQSEAVPPAPRSTVPKKAPQQTVSSNHDDVDDLNIALLDDDEDLGFLLDEAEGRSSAETSEAAAIAAKKEPSPVALGEEDDLSLELSDDDLESFLQELDEEESSGRKASPAKKQIKS